ncbi:unnamed protein product, partial [Polarella glacialis]
MILRAPGSVAARSQQSSRRCAAAATPAPILRRSPGASASSSSGPPLPRAGEPVPFLGFAQSARRDVAGLLGQLEGPDWVQRLHALSSVALDLWPSDSPHWRVAGSVVVPPEVSSSKRFAQELADALRVRKSPVTSEESASTFSASHGLGPTARATVIRALCELQGGGLATRSNAHVLLASLVDNKGVTQARKDSGLAYQVSVQELCQCILALSESSVCFSADGWATEDSLKDSPVKDFVAEGAKRLLLVLETLALPELLSLRKALSRCGVDRSGIDEELRQRLLEVAGGAKSRKKKSARGAKLSDAKSDLIALVAGAQALGEVAVLRSQPLRQAMLPDALSPGQAAELLLHALPLEGALTSAHELVVAQATRQIVSGAKTLTPRQLAAAARGALALQARGDEFTIQHASRVLRALWSRVVLRHANFGPTELCDILRAYWWQLQYSRQELALAGTTQTHPVVAELHLGDSSPNTRNAAKEVKATDDLCTKLLRPTLSRLGEMPLKQVAACLTALAPPVRPPDAMSSADRLVLREAVAAAFPAGIASRAARSVPKSTKEEAEDLPAPEGWTEEFWAGEMLSMQLLELLELACGLREAGMGSRVWPLDAVVAEIDQRLRPTDRKAKPPVELSHFLLLRLCRVIDLWHGHEVEEILKHLLSNPEAVKPLPTSYFVAVLSALCDFAVPKELPLRLVSSFLERVERGERSVQPEQWAEILRAISPLDEWPSFERITPRLLQRLVPHLSGLPPPVLATLLVKLAEKPFPREVSGGHSPLELVPS